MSTLRSHARVIRVLWVIALGLTIAGIFALMERLRIGASMARRQRWTSWFMRRLTAALPFRVRVSGHMPGQPMLWVCNHVSWTDIPLLGMLAPLSFLSKAEVRTWPVAGWLALKAGTLFIRRGSGDSKLIQKQMGQHLLGNHSLVIFPEGTRVAHGASPPLQAGFAGLYKLLGLPVVPIAVNSGPAYHRLIKRRRQITYQVGEMIPAGLPREEIEARVHAAINALNPLP